MYQNFPKWKRQGRITLPQILAYEIKVCFQIGVEQAFGW
jgi:hypothetical protein